ncbi:glycosyltransferase [Caulobacter sp. LjRoot300]|uniref:glycosyltransferase n=1 Tax=Caulobacter sp. LjRoot300 TaxID=3342321 RepID=UPI003ECD8B1A
MPAILSLTTYPIAAPRHGGQRRVAAFGDFYRGLGLDFQSASIYQSPPYQAHEVGRHDLKLGHVDPRWNGVPFVDDILSGDFAATGSGLAHFRQVIETVRPAAIQLDHPFMWPLVRVLRDEGLLADVKLFYSSHNWEAPLKVDILRRSGVPEARAAEVGERILELERDVIEASDLIVAVSESDAAQYRALTDDTPVHVVPNGVQRSPGDAVLTPAQRKIFGDKPFALFVGSAYPPNIEGFCNLVADGGLYMAPPEKRFAVCGGVSDGIFNSRQYQRFLIANSERLHFFPDISDDDLSALKAACHVVLLPIQFGGGSNLKTAEALASNKHVIATSTAMRGFDAFRDAPGVVIADTPETFRRAIAQVFKQPSLKLKKKDLLLRETVYWDRGFADSTLANDVRALLKLDQAA